MFLSRVRTLNMVLFIAVLSLAVIGYSQFRVNAQELTGLIIAKVKIAEAACGAARADGVLCSIPESPAEAVGFEIEPIETVAGMNRYHIETDNEGAFSITLPVGRYRIELSRSVGPYQFLAQNIEVRPRVTNEIELILTALRP